ncbi:MAG TPA: ATP-grasp domain-containing protein [Actinomycetales bacterium]|nr:ATP-grasp domain-containing protein [Actinomycetales bacterium]
MVNDDVTSFPQDPTTPEGQVPSVSPDGGASAGPDGTGIREVRQADGTTRVEWDDPFAKGRAEALGQEDHAGVWDSAFAAASKTSGDETAGESDEASDAVAPQSAGDHAVKVAIVAGGLGHERDISIRSGRRAAQVLRDQGVEVQVWDLDQSLTGKLEEWQPDVVWPLVHGAHGEDGSLQDLIALLGFPCVGADGPGARLASHKPTAKALIASSGLPTPNWITLTQALFRQIGSQNILDAVVEGIGLPVVVKPADGGSALGLTIVRDAAELPAAMVSAFAYAQEALVEHFVEGTEVSASVVALDGPGSARTLDLVEVDSEGGYDFDARYNPGRAEFFVPARLEDEVTEKVRHMAAEIHSVFGLGELSRVDFIVDSEGTPWVVDINVAPGMTETSLFPQAAASAGPELYSAIIRAAIADVVEGEEDQPDVTDGAPGQANDEDGAGALDVTEGAQGPADEGDGAGTPSSEIRALAGLGEGETDLPQCPACGARRTHHLVFGLGEAPGKPNTIYGGTPMPESGPWPNLQCVVCGKRWHDESVEAD